MPWWGWILAGLVLLALELMAPAGFFLFFLGLSGLVVGLLAYLNVANSETIQWGLFSLIALLAILFFRKQMLGLFPSKFNRADTDSMLGEIVVLSESIAPAAIGQVEFRGTTWSARNVGNERIESGTKAQITAVDGITLSVKSI